jgi:hypothetical protein
MFQIKIGSEVHHKERFADAFVEACLLANESGRFATIVAPSDDCIGLDKAETMVVNPKLSN